MAPKAEKKTPKAKGGTAKVTKEKKEKKVKDPNAPKKPKSAYFFFMDDVRDKIKKENPDASFGELGKLMGAAWKDVSDKEKEKYNKKNVADKERYEKELAKYNKGK